MKRLSILGLLTLSMFLCSCNPNNLNNENSDKIDSNNNSASSENAASTSFEEIKEIDYGEFNVATNDGEFSFLDGVYSLTKAGTYDIEGTLSEGYIYVNAGEDDEVILNLNNVSITSSINSPIYAISADKLEIHTNSGYSNVIIDNREIKTQDDDTQGNGAIYSKCDLKLTGKGLLNVQGNYNNGVHSTKDLKIKNNTLTVNSANNCLKGNDSVAIESGDLLLISSGGNGIITEDSDISSKGNQRGNIDITGGSISIYSCKDAIDAANDVNIANSISNGETVIPSINVHTSNYSSYSGEVVSSTDNEYYIKLNASINTSYRLSVYYKDNEGNYNWSNASYVSSMNEQQGNRPGRGSTYYYYGFSMPSSATSMQLFCFLSSSENSTESYAAKSDTYSVNANYDTAVFSINNNSFSLSGWTTYSTQQNSGGMGPGGNVPGGGMDQGNTQKSSYSAKGIKADNTVNISGGEINIKAYDDAIHANYGNTLENESVGKGEVYISGGDLTLYCSDDAIHADRTLNISGGNIVINNSYEGLEGNVINVTGGDILVYASDDGVNANSKGGLSTSINVSGGKIDITVASGDTDGIDSNGSYSQTGGVVISRGSGTNMSTGLDCDGQATISGGTFIAFGKTEKTLSLSSNVKSQTFSNTFTAKTYTFKCGDTAITTINKSSYSGVYIYSDLGNSFTYE